MFVWDAGCEIRDRGGEGCEIRDSGWGGERFGMGEMRDAGFGMGMGEMRDTGCGIRDRRGAGYGIGEMRDSGWGGIRDSRWGRGEIRDTGFGIRDGGWERYGIRDREILDVRCDIFYFFERWFISTLWINRFSFAPSVFKRLCMF